MERWDDICLQNEDDKVFVSREADEKETFDTRWHLVWRLLTKRFSKFNVFQNVMASLWHPGQSGYHNSGGGGEKGVGVYGAEWVGVLDLVEMEKQKLGVEGDGPIVVVGEATEEATVLGYSKDHIDIIVVVGGMEAWRLTSLYEKEC
uniref:Uncharacterized protein n=1 Tax=Cannabis sativa TaxID=3483 RepID=A0A803P651_CANSA